MPPFRRVDARKAGPAALGILVPPGQRTILVLRPRGLPWDLLAMRDDPAQPAAFCEFGRDEAAQVARAVQRSLETAANAGRQLVEVLAHPSLPGCWVQARLELFALIVCGRLPQQAYQPLLWATPEEAQTAAARLGPILCPPVEGEQEYYFNTQNFHD